MVIFLKRVYECQIGGQGVVGRPLVRWINRTEEYMRGGMWGINFTKRECMNRENWRLLPWSSPCGEVLKRT